jgi:hypothetical protein
VPIGERDGSGKANPSARACSSTVAVEQAVATLTAATALAEVPARGSIIIILDGKSLRGTIPLGQSAGVHLLAAYQPDIGSVHAQVAVDRKTNEIGAAPSVVRQLKLSGVVVTGDAMFAQRELSTQIVEGGGDYFWWVKENQPSGLLGISGSTADMRDLLDQESRDPCASTAIALFCYQARKFVGALAAVLGGLDTLIFTGGIGEHAAPIRARICADMDFLGIQIDERRNGTHASIISRDDSAATVRVMPSNEDLMIARHTYRLLSERGAEHVEV